MADHPELVSEKKYIEDFKTTILYCYNYEFTSSASNEQKARRIKNILNNYVNQSDKKEKKENKIRFINKASESMKDNPFQRFYRFRRFIPVTYPSYFLHIIAALSPFFDRRDYENFGDCDGDGDCDKDNYFMLAAKFVHLTEKQKDDLFAGKRISARRRLDDMDRIYYMPADEAAETIKSFGLTPEKEKVLTDALQKSLSEDYFSHTYFDGKEKTPDAHLKKLEKIGILSRKFSPGNSGHKKNAYWYLPQITIDKLINEGSRADMQFEQHLRSALDFFSRYYAFGEIGVYLLDRMGWNYNSPFRFRHDYFMQSLCDFHVIDLLNAAEEKKWCLIEYHHAVADFDTKLLCYPLQIRVGSSNGKEYLMFYDPIRHCYSALRIEFIRNITYYSFKKVETVLSEHGVIGSAEAVAQEIENSREGLKYLWGADTPSLPGEDHINNALAPSEPKHIMMQIKYDPAEEDHIRRRLYRERRHGKVTELSEEGLLQFDIDVASPFELIPWIRSFYKRIVKLEGFEAERFTLEGDLKKMQKALEGGELPPEESVKPKEIWSVPEEIKNGLGKGTEADGHNLIFHQIFTVYYYIFADVLTSLTMNVTSLSEKELKREIIASGNKMADKYKNRVGDATTKKLSEQLRKIFLKNNFFIKKQANGKDVYSPVYKTDRQLDFYREVLPLSVMEKRWLMTIVKDPKIYLFLTGDEVKFIKAFFGKYESALKPLPIENIVCYDRYHIPGKKTNEIGGAEEISSSDAQRRIMSVILEGISSQKLLNITYRKKRGKPIQGRFAPAAIEYSKRNNSLQGYFLTQGRSDKPVKIFNFRQIEKISVADGEFDYEAAEKKYDRDIKEKTAAVEFDFIDNRNLADRILTEFSPWKRECVRNGKRYTMKLYYRRGIGSDKGEEFDIVLRLMSFGGVLRFTDKNLSIVQNIRERVDEQLELLREKGIIKDDGDS